MKLVLLLATLCVATICVAQVPTPMPTVPPLLRMWNTSLAQFGTNFNIRVANKGHLAVVASWYPWASNAISNVTGITTRHGAILWSQPMRPPTDTQAVYFAASESHIAVVDRALLTLDVNGGVVWSTQAPFTDNITGVAIIEEGPDSTLIIAATRTGLVYVRNGIVANTIPGSYGPVVLVVDEVVVTTSNNQFGTVDVNAHRRDNGTWMWTVNLVGGVLTQKSVGGAEVAIVSQSFVLVVDLHTGSTKHNISMASGCQIFDASVSDSWVIVSAINMNFDTPQLVKGRNAYPSLVSAYNKANLSAVVWTYNTDATQTGVTIDEPTEQVAFATSQSLVVLNISSGAIRGKLTKVQDYAQLDRPAIVRSLESVLFTGGLKESDDFSLISTHVKS